MPQALPAVQNGSPTLRLILLFLVIPVIEILLFIEIGGAIGTWETIGIVIATAFLGVFAIRSQGRHAMAEILSDVRQQRAPKRALAEATLLMVAGLMLIMPGFFTDTIGILLLIPPIRGALAGRIADQMQIPEPGRPRTGPGRRR